MNKRPVRTAARSTDGDDLSQTKVNLREILIRAADQLVARCKSDKPSYTRSILVEYALSKYLIEVGKRTIPRPDIEEMSRFDASELREDLAVFLD